MGTEELKLIIGLIILMPIAFIILHYRNSFSYKYFLSGLKLISIHNEYSSSASIDLNTNEIEKSFDTIKFPPITIKKYNDNKYVFREKFFYFAIFAYTGIMVGNVNIDNRIGQIVVEGIMPYWDISFIIIFMLWMMIFNIYFGFILFLLVIISYIIVFKIQKSRFTQMLNIIIDQTNM